MPDGDAETWERDTSLCSKEQPSKQGSEDVTARRCSGITAPSSQSAKNHGNPCGTYAHKTTASSEAGDKHCALTRVKKINLQGSRSLAVVVQPLSQH